MREEGRVGVSELRIKSQGIGGPVGRVVISEARGHEFKQALDGVYFYPSVLKIPKLSAINA